MDNNYNPQTPFDNDQPSQSDTPEIQVLQAKHQSAIFNKRNVLILSILIGLAAVIAAAIFITNTLAERPERVLSRAFSELIEADNFNVEVKSETKTKGNQFSTKSELARTPELAALSLEFKTDTSVTGETYYNRGSVDLISAAKSSGHTVYLKPNDAKSTIDNMIANAARQYDYDAMGSDQLRTYVPNLTDDQLQDVRGSMHAAIDPQAAKVDNQWIEIPYELKKEDRKQPVSCFNQLLSLPRTSPELRELVKSAYKENPFITNKSQLGIKGSLSGYVISFDRDKLDDFFDELKKHSTLEGFVTSCRNDLKSFTDKRELEINKSHLEFWVNRQTNRLALINLDLNHDWKPYEILQGSQKPVQEAKTRFELQFTYGSANIKLPEKSLKYSNLKTETQELKSFFLAGDEPSQGPEPEQE